MIDLPIGTEGIRAIIEYRTEVANHIFSAISYMGEVEGYVLILSFIYLVYDKSLAYKLSVLVLLSMCANHLLKSIFGIQRPFVHEGTYQDNWLVSPENGQELVTEYSTPSGHAMSSSVFYGYIIIAIKNRKIQFTLFLTILLIGFSRPYLAVHYLEDILLGWVFGYIIIYSVQKYSKNIDLKWNSMRLPYQTLIIFIGSLLLWVLTFFINGADVKSQPLPFVGYLGFLMGVHIGYSKESQYIKFDPKSKSALIKILRWIIAVMLIMIPIILLDELFESNWNEPTYGSHILQYIGYAFAGWIGMFLAPNILVKLKMLEIPKDNVPVPNT